MTAAVAVMTATSPPSSLPKRHGFSIESLIGKPDSPPSPRLPPPQLHHHHHHQLHHHHPQQLSSSPTSPINVSKSTPTSTPPPARPVAVKPNLSKDFTKQEKHREPERESFTHRELIREEILREREMRHSRDKEARMREKEIDILREREAREREMAIESMREREKELRDIRELKERAEMARERELQQQRRAECVDSGVGRNCPASYPVKNTSPRSNTPPSPLLEKSVSPTESENRLSVWGGAEDFKHLLGGFPGGHLDSNGIYQPLRVCNRTLASMNGIGGSPAAAGPLGMSIAPQFAHLPMNPFFPRDLPPHHAHPLLAARYPGFMHHRYPMGPPPGLLFHPYRKPKRNRTAFSPNQLLQLEQAFEKNHYVVGQERKSLAAKLQLTETQVKVWFQNRRTKHKRMKAEEDGGSSGSHPDGHGGESGRGDDGSDLMTYMDHEEDDHCTSDDEDEELSVTEDS